MFCPSCATESAPRAKYCHNCGVILPLSDFSSSASTGNTKSESSGGNFSYAHFRKQKESDRKRHFKPSAPASGKRKCVPSEPTIETIQTGILLPKEDGDLVAKRGCGLPLKVCTSDTKEVLLQKAVEKHHRFNRSLVQFDDPSHYKLLYPDKTEVESKISWIKSGDQTFTIGKNKEELGKAYSRITLLLCSSMDYLGYLKKSLISDEMDHDHSSEFGSDDNSDVIHIRSIKGISSSQSSLAGQSCSAGPSVSANPTIQNLQNHTTTASPMSDVSSNIDLLPFLWEETEINTLDEDELLKAAIARSLEHETSAEKVALQECLTNFQKKIVPSRCELVILRKRLLGTCLNSIKEPNFDFFTMPSFRFIGEEADDFGGPTREFFRLLMKTLCEEFGVFEGKPHSVVFGYSHDALEKKKPFLAGQFLAWSLLHGGPGLHAMARATFLFMVGVSVPLHCDLGEAIAAIMDEEIVLIVKDLQEAEGDKEFADAKIKHMTWLLDHGITLHSVTKEAIINEVVKESLYFRVKPSIDQFVTGMDSVGGLFSDYVKKWPFEFLSLFVHIPKPLTPNLFRGLYAVVWSEEGSNKRSVEEDTIYCFEKFLQKANEGSLCCTLSDLLIFVTGADRVPPNGFKKLIKLKFFDNEEGQERRPSASTCALELYLPRGYSETDKFDSLMSSAINDSLGFGKV